MPNAAELLKTEIVAQCLRAQAAESRLRELEHMLDALGVALWQTDTDLRLVSSCGVVLADSYLNRPIAELYRDAYGVETDEGPILAHKEARAGQSVTLHWRHGNGRFALIVEPQRDARGTVVGTVGMALKLTE